MYRFKHEKERRNTFETLRGKELALLLKFRRCLPGRDHLLGPVFSLSEGGSESEESIVVVVIVVIVFVVVFIVITDDIVILSRSPKRRRGRTLI